MVDVLATCLPSHAVSTERTTVTTALTLARTTALTATPTPARLTTAHRATMTTVPNAVAAAGSSHRTSDSSGQDDSSH